MNKNLELLFMYLWDFVMATLDATTKYHRLGRLNRNLFLTVLEAEKSKIKVLGRKASF